MKIIELLNKIANGEEVPKKIKYKDDIYIHVDNHCYVCEETYEILSNNIYAEHNSLNDEIEIIEEKEMCHKCGKYPAEYNQTYCEFCLGISEEDKKIEPLKLNNSDVWTGRTNEDLIADKINEIIDKLNKEE